VSKPKLFPIFVSLTLLHQAALLCAADYTNFVETTYDDANWVLVTSERILRANICVASDEQEWYEKVFNPCYSVNRYWKFAQGAASGRAFTIAAIKAGDTTDSLYVPTGFGFQLYDANSQPFGPYRGGARYVSLEHWRYTFPPPDGFEPGTLFVPGSAGHLVDYSIIVAPYPLHLTKTHDADPNGVSQEEFFTYQISYENDPDGLSDPNDPNSGPQDANDLIIVDLVPIELDFNWASDGGTYDSDTHTVTWNIGDLSIGSSGSVELSVKVNRYAIPGAIITNYSEIKNDGLSAGAAVDVNVLYKPPLMTLQKVDNLGPSETVLPDSNITYTITYDANGHNLTDVNIVDYLHDDVDFISASEPNTTYDSTTQTVTWRIGTVSSGESNSVTVTVKVNNLAEPLGAITNFCKIETASSYNSATAYTNVGSWNPGIIYVNADKRTTWSNTGMSWKNAYVDLQDALERAGAGCGSQIWVAAGVYKPTIPSGDYATFELIEGVPLYGGFSGGETALAQRNPIKNQSALDGRADLYDVVTASDVNQTAIIDGFTIRGGMLFDDGSGIYCDTGSPTIANCKIANNFNGIYCESQSAPTIIDCNVEHNPYDGILCASSDANITRCVIKRNGYSTDVVVDGGIRSSSSNLTITNCIIHGNYDHGIRTYSGTPTIKNNWIYQNGADGTGDGIYLNDADAQTVIRNNTIADNNDYGLRVIGYGRPITNSIVWGNGYAQIFNSTPYYSCIQNGGTTNDNINTNPLFVDDANDNYHISPNSPCIDEGEPNSTDPNETDIDGEMRIVDGDGNDTDIVDMGADEYYASPADFNGDGIVNFFDYDILALAWGRSSDDPNYNDVPDLNDNNSIDNNDLSLFCAEWLWTAGWTKSAEEMMRCGMRTMGMGFAQEFYALESAEEEPTPTAQTSTTTETQPSPLPELDDAQIEELIQWLEEILEDDLTKEQIGEQDWDEFVDGINYIIESLKEELEE
jgi:parallel beta-helix repeat protein